MKDEKIIPLVAVERKPLMRYAIMMQQLGRLGGDIIYYLRGLDTHLDKFDVTKLKVNMSDAMVQMELMCKDLELDPNEVIAMGRERYLDRKAEWIAKGKGGSFV